LQNKPENQNTAPGKKIVANSVVVQELLLDSLASADFALEN
jgi:hypothetical protein